MDNNNPRKPPNPNPRPIKRISPYATESRPKLKQPRKYPIYPLGHNGSPPPGHNGPRPHKPSKPHNDLLEYKKPPKPIALGKKPLSKAVKSTKNIGKTDNTKKTKPIKKRRDIDIDKKFDTKVHAKLLTRERERSARSVRSVSIVAGIFFTFVIIYMVRAAAVALSVDIHLTAVRIDTLESSVSVSGVIVRYEYVHTADRDGRAIFFVSANDRVPPNMRVVSIQDVDAVRQIDHDLASLEDAIKELNERRLFTVIDASINHINSNLRSTIDRNMHSFTTRNLQELHSVHDTLIEAINERNRQILDESRNISREQGAMHEALINQRELNSTNMYANISGIMSPIIDGFEGILYPGRMRYLSRDEVRRIVDFTTVTPVRDVSYGDPVFKIVGNTWYVVSYMPNEMIQNFTVGSMQTVYLQSAATGQYVPMNMRVASIYSSPSDSLVILRSNQHVIDFIGQRNISVRTGHNVQQGFSIPVTAITSRTFYTIPLDYIHVTEENTSVIVLHANNMQQLVPVEISRISGTHAYIRDIYTILAFGDVLKPVYEWYNPFLLSEFDVHLAHGLYRANLGFAEFREIFLDDNETLTGTNVLLNISRNPYIMQFDLIVTDATRVQQGMIL